MVDSIPNVTPLENKPKNNYIVYTILVVTLLVTVTIVFFLLFKIKNNNSFVGNKLKTGLQRISPTIKLTNENLIPSMPSSKNKDCEPPYFEKCEVNTYSCTTTNKYKNQILKGFIVEENYLSDKQIKNRTKYCYTPDRQDKVFLDDWNQEGCYEMKDDRFSGDGAGWNFSGNYPLCFAQKIPGYYFTDYVYTNEKNATFEASVKNQQWITYKSKIFNYSFQYPSTWGEVKETFEADKSAYSGKSYNLTFTKNNKIYAGGLSKDYSAGRGGGLSPFSIIEPVIVPSIRHMIDIQDPDCFTMGGRNSFFGAINITLPNAKLMNGITFLSTILSDQDRERINWKFLVNNEGLNCEQVKDESLSKEKAKRILVYIETEKNIDNESLQNLLTFNQFVQGFSLNK